MTDTLAEDYATTMRESLEDLMSRYTGDSHDDECERTVEDEDCDCQDRTSDEMTERPLEVVAERGEPFSVLLTFGGPNAYVEWSGRRGPESAELHVYWGGDHAIRRSDAIRAYATYWDEILTEGDAR